MFYGSVTSLNIDCIVVSICIRFTGEAGGSKVFLPYVAKGVWSLTLLYGISLHEALMVFLFCAVSGFSGQERIRRTSVAKSITFLKDTNLNLWQVLQTFLKYIWGSYLLLLLFKVNDDWLMMNFLESLSYFHTSIVELQNLSLAWYYINMMKNIFLIFCIVNNCPRECRWLLLLAERK